MRMKGGRFGRWPGRTAGGAEKGRPPRRLCALASPEALSALLCLFALNRPLGRLLHFLAGRFAPLPPETPEYGREYVQAFQRQGRFLDAWAPLIFLFILAAVYFLFRALLKKLGRRSFFTGRYWGAGAAGGREGEGGG